MLRRVLNDPDRCQDVVAHRLVFCPTAQSRPTEHLFLECWCCGRFLVYCCACTERQRLAESRRRYFSAKEPLPCHYYKVAFVDGACSGNGHHEATSGIGVAVGVDPDAMHWAIHIDDEVDPGSVRTSERAELLAAMHGIYKLAEFQDKSGNIQREHGDSDDKITWVIASDSEYVVLGMTEWVPTWRGNGWRTSTNKRPKNLDLFRRLEAVVERYEHEYGVQIAFWRIGRAHNEIADGLQKAV